MNGLTWDVDLELPALAEGAVDDPQLPGGQVHLEPREELDVGLLFEEGAADHVVVVHYLCVYGGVSVLGGGGPLGGRPCSPPRHPLCWAGSEC